MVQIKKREVKKKKLIICGSLLDWLLSLATHPTIRGSWDLNEGNHDMSDVLTINEMYRIR